MILAKILLTSFSLLALAGAPAYANQAQEKSVHLNAGEVRASRLIGMDVVNLQNEDLGEIKDLVIDLRTGRAHAAVLEFDGFVGLGEKRYAFPARRLTPGLDREKVILNVDKESLESAQGFAKERWPAMDDAYWTKMERERDAAAGASGGKPTLVRASELIGKHVQDKRGEDVGAVTEVIVNLVDGRIRHFVIQAEDGPQARVQPKMLSAGSGEELMLNTSLDELRAHRSAALEK